MTTTTRAESIGAADGGRIDATAVLGASGGPGILLLQEVWGVGEFVLDKARALAEAGYVVLCPDVFWRVERNVDLPHDDDGLRRAYGYMDRFLAVDPAVTAGDLLAGLSHLRALPEVGGPVAVMGYCLGGRLAYEVAVAGDPDACVSYYGSGIADRLEDAGRIACPTLLQFGSADPFIPLDQVRRIEAAFSDRLDVEVHVLPGAGHAFENSFAPAFSDPAAAAVSWPVTLEFLERVLGAPRR